MELSNRASFFLPTGQNGGRNRDKVYCISRVTGANQSSRKWISVALINTKVSYNLIPQADV